jgi:hypothetical protein
MNFLLRAGERCRQTCEAAHNIRTRHFPNLVSVSLDQGTQAVL